MVRQKKPAKVYDDASVISLAGVEPSVIDAYSKQLLFTGINKGNKHRKVYEFVRNMMNDSLIDKHRKDPLFAALIERIARMTVILDKIELQLLKDLPEMTEMQINERLGKNYLSYLREYRGFVTAFSDLRWVGDHLQKTKAIEKTREITREVSVENDTP